MKRILAVICLAAVIISIFVTAQTERTGPSSGMRFYNAGKYKVGKNLDPGEYILFSAPFRKGFFAVFVDADSMDVISNGSFDTNTILTVEEGDDLVLADCIAIYADDYYSMSRINLNQSGGMLKVGADLQPGEYDLISQDKKTAVYRIYNDMRFRLIAEEREFTGASQVSLEENQYLELVNCFVDPKQTATPTPRPKPSPSPTPKPEAADASGGKSTKKPSGKKTPKPEKAQQQSELTHTSAPTPTPIPTRVPTPSPTPTPRVIRKVRIDPRRSPTIRSIPSTMGEKLGVAKAGAEYELLQVEKKWYKIRLENGMEGWITAGMAEIVKTR